MDTLRAAITDAYRRPETECVPALIDEARLPDPVSESARQLALSLVAPLRQKRVHDSSGVEGLIQEYSLSTEEGIALMCLAEALLRIPDAPTRDALIRDKISGADWAAHLGNSPSLLVNAATWALLITGKMTSTTSEGGVYSALTRLIGKGGEPLIRKGVDMAMRLMGEQFVTGQTIDAALANSRNMEAKGFRYSYDCLGEAATTSADADRYYADYEKAIHAIGQSAQRGGRPQGIYEGPGISVKLSALHPRYSRAQRERVRSELIPRLKALTNLARRYDIAINIDAEEADRLELSLECLEALCVDPALEGWNGIGFVIQGYQKRCRFLVDWIIDLARRSRHRLMIRLVKGAYWDSEIKRAQIDGLEGFPVFTRKVYTDVSYLACAKRLLSAPDAVFPQFATHNAHTLATIVKMAGENFYAGQYEFQCLHGMGEPLYEEVVGVGKLNRPCRIYAPVGTHETLLAYLVRRLLENGANTSFVNRIADASVSVDELVADPVAVAAAIKPLGAPHPKIVLPSTLYGTSRRNSAGLDLSNEYRLQELAEHLEAKESASYAAGPQIEAPLAPSSLAAVPVLNPANHRDIVGSVVYASPREVEVACEHAALNLSGWSSTPVHERARILTSAATLIEKKRLDLISLLVREAGKSIPNAVGEIREAVDFLRYYAVQAVELHGTDSAAGGRALGPIVCISPWNFPLAIFLGQIGAALVAGNTVLAKPAEETPLIAHAAVTLLHQAGVPTGALQCLPGAGEVGAALVASASIHGVMFTGSTEVARMIQAQLATRLTQDGNPIPFIAETGGLNAMIVDSSALAEQVVGDAITSAFDSAGQRCSALRLLCLQEDVADRVLTMLKGAMRELSTGNPAKLATDIGPVITQGAQTSIQTHIDGCRRSGFSVEQAEARQEGGVSDTVDGTFVPPTVIEINRVADLRREIFGPVLHVLRYRRENLDSLIEDINATGYGLTFGLHSRIDETIELVTERIAAGNLYVNRNIIGAVVGVQPFGGNGLSGTGPKAGGPHYLARLMADARPVSPAPTHNPTAAPSEYQRFLVEQGQALAAERLVQLLRNLPEMGSTELLGPVGEKNLLLLKPRGRIAVLAKDKVELLVQIGAVLATGNEAVVPANSTIASELAHLPLAIARRIVQVDDWRRATNLAGVLASGSEVASINSEVSQLAGPILIVQGPRFQLDLLMREVSVSVNTAAAGGNAALMSIHE